MRQHFVSISIVSAFALGCAATSVFKIPVAHAQSPARWEYLCISYGPFEAPTDVHTKLNQAGAQGWELQAAFSRPGDANALLCLKRPAPSGPSPRVTP